MGALRHVGIVGFAMMGTLLAGISIGRDPDHRSPVAAPPAMAAINLQVLPKDTSYADLAVLMSRYSQDLGVQCVFCHTQNPQTQAIDFASDESPAKLTARIMIGMVRDINDKYLAQVSDRRYAVPIRCGNCHQGQTFPPPFEARSAPSVQWSVVTKRLSAGDRHGAVEVSAAVPQGWHVYAPHQAAGGPTPLLVTLDSDAAARVVGPPSGTLPNTRHDPSFDLDTEYYNRDFALSFPIESEHALADSPPLPVSIRFQLCSERECQPPRTVRLLAPIATEVQK